MICRCLKFQKCKAGFPIHEFLEMCRVLYGCSITLYLFCFRDLCPSFFIQEIYLIRVKINVGPSQINQACARYRRYPSRRYGTIEPAAGGNLFDSSRATVRENFPVCVPQDGNGTGRREDNREAGWDGNS